MSKLIVYYGSTASFNNLDSFNADGVDGYAIGTASPNIKFAGSAPSFISVWFKPDSVSFRKTLLNVAINNLAGGSGYFIYQNGQQIICSMAYLSRQLEIRTTSNVLSIGNWYNVVWAKPDNNASNSSIYLNGSLVAKTVVTNTLLAGDLPAYAHCVIGRMYRSSSPDYYDGKIFHPAIGNISVDATQANEIYTKKAGDLRTLSFGSNVKTAFHFENGQADYPGWKNYIDNAYNLTLTNSVIGDINSVVP